MSVSLWPDYATASSHTSVIRSAGGRTIAGLASTTSQLTRSARCAGGGIGVMIDTLASKETT